MLFGHTSGADEDGFFLGGEVVQIAPNGRIPWESPSTLKTKEPLDKNTLVGCFILRVELLYCSLGRKFFIGSSVKFERSFYLFFFYLSHYLYSYVQFSCCCFKWRPVKKQKKN